MKEIKPPCGGHASGMGNTYRCFSWACSTVSEKRRFESLRKDAERSGATNGLIFKDHHYTNQTERAAA
jgi:hypothetical protein